MSRKLEDLNLETRGKCRNVLSLCEARGIDVVLLNTRRSFEEQARLYRKGRSICKIQEKEDELRFKWGRPDLAEILINVGPQAGKLIVTNAGPGQSIHNYGGAFDSVVLMNGKAVWEINDGVNDEEELELWNRYGSIVEECGLEWGGRWTDPADYPHAQEPGVDWRDLIRAG